VPKSLITIGLVAVAMVLCGAARAGGEGKVSDSSVKGLMTKALAGGNAREVRVLTVEYPPGGASPVHRHNAQVFVYVLDGTVEMQVAGGPLLTLGPGDTFYEGPGDVHAVSANASATRPARILVFMIKDTGAPVSLPADAR
jgi:quercetin dioxygenase-like cupin family protein